MSGLLRAGDAIRSLFGMNQSEFVEVERLPFPAYVTAVTQDANGFWRYAFQEQAWDPVTGAWVQAIPGRTGDTSAGISMAFEANNVRVTPPFYVNQMRPRGMVAAQMVYDFEVFTGSGIGTAFPPATNISTTTALSPTILGPIFPVNATGTPVLLGIVPPFTVATGQALTITIINVGSVPLVIQSGGGGSFPFSLPGGASINIPVGGSITVTLQGGGSTGTWFATGTPAGLILPNYPSSTNISTTTGLSPGTLGAIFPVNATGTPVLTGITPPWVIAAGQTFLTTLVNTGSVPLILQSGGGGSFPFSFPGTLAMTVAAGAAIPLLLQATSTTAGTWFAGGLPSGTLAQKQGGTGEDTSGVTDGQLLIGKTSNNSFTLSTLTAGSGITVTNGGGSITVASSGSGPTGTNGQSTLGSPYTLTGSLANVGVSVSIPSSGTYEISWYAESQPTGGANPATVYSINDGSSDITGTVHGNTFTLAGTVYSNNGQSVHYTASGAVTINLRAAFAGSATGGTVQTSPTCYLNYVKLA